MDFHFECLGKRTAIPFSRHFFPKNLSAVLIVCIVRITLFGLFWSQPPISMEHASELGEWEEREVKVSGRSWDVNSIDIAVAGLGWFSFGLKGEATLTLWTYDGIEITLREPLVLDRAPFLEKPGFWLPNAVTDGAYSQTKVQVHKKKRLREVSSDFLSDASV